ncbi:MAG: PAS domain S-box [Methanobacterium sp. Maddingley MBC34]|nr:MAG: PAS domain S-box [Methanobacterium sp. Maddingley MBC34]
MIFLAKEKILLVEDDGIEAMDIKRTLESFGYDVPYVASQGEEAIGKTLEIQPDLILMDIVLKGEINGIDTASKIKELSIPVIYLTAHSEDATVQRAKLTEPYGYIIKPYDSYELKYAIELALYKSKMEKKLRESERRYKFIVEAANEGIWSMDADFNTIYVNQKMAQMLGYTVDEMMGKPVTTFMFDEDIPDHQKRMKKRFEGASESYERRFKHKQGWEVSTLVAATALMNVNGKFNGSFGMFTDITHRKKVEKQLNDSQRQLNDIIDSSPILQFVIDKNHHVLYWNQAMASYSGISPEEIIGTDQHWKAFYSGKRPCLADLILDEDIITIDKWYSGKYEESEYLKGAFEVEDFFPSLGVTGKWLRFTAAPLKDSEGEIMGALETLEDITQRKMAENALKESEEKFRVLADNAPVSIIVYQKNKAVYANEYAVKLSGYSKEELLAMNFWEGFHPDDQKMLKDRGKARLRGEKVPNTYEVKYVTKSGKIRYIVISAGRIIYGGKPAVLAILIDITDDKKVETKLRQSEERLMMGMDMAKLVYWEYDTQSDMFTFDDQFYALYGTSAQMEGGNKMSSQEYATRFVPPEEHALVGGEVAKALETEDPDYSSTLQHSIIRADGEKRFIIVRIRIAMDENGHKIGTRGVNQDITELVLAEENLARSESKYRAIFDNIKSAVAVYTAIENGSDFVFKDFNPAAEEIDEIKREDVIGRKVTEVFPAVVKFGLLETFQNVWKTGKAEKKPISIYEDERVSGWRENYVYKLPSGDIVAVYDDLTEIKQYEEELEQNQNRLRSLVRILQYRSESVQDFLDYALEEAINLTESKLGYIYYYHEDRKEFILNTWSKEVMDECTITDKQSVYELDKTGIWGEAVRQKKPIILNDFKVFHPLKRGYPEGHAPLHKFMTIPVISGDEIVAVVGVANKETNYTETDVLQLELLMDAVWKVLDSQRAEEALKKSETRYRAIFENTGTATAISEDNMILSLVNEEFVNLTGFSRKKIENKMTWADFFTEEELPQMKEYHKLRRIQPNAAPRTYESVLKDRWGNTKDVYMSVTMLPDTKKSLVSVLDITEKKQSRIKLRRELKINQSLANIYAPLISPDTTIQDVSIAILKESLALSASEHGFVATIDPENRDMVNQTLTRMMPQCEVYGEGKIPEEIRFPIGPDGIYPGLWGHCLNTKKSFFTNDAANHPSAKGAPAGHIKIERFLAVPVMVGEKIVGQLALANPDRNYMDNDVNSIERIAEFFALAIQRKGYEERISKSLDEKDLLLREIHHRVKNNMQIISSILNLQSFAVKDPKLLDILKQNQNRIKSMAMIHEKLYQSHDLVEIDFSEYLESLTADIFYTYSIRAAEIDFDLEIDKKIMLNIETAIPCGLIYSELLSNSIKHAFPHDQGGKIIVEFKRIDDELMLRVSDNGVGLPEEFDFQKTETLGLQLITNLVKQIDGIIKLEKTHGTAFTVKFHELQYKDRMQSD